MTTRRWAPLLLVLLLTLLAGASPAAGQAARPLADVTVTGTATEIRPDNPQRRAVSCTNHSTTVAVRWGDASTTATRGQRIPAEASIEILATGPLFMISEGANVTMSCTEELK
jgi:hypothetical protein